MTLEDCKYLLWIKLKITKQKFNFKIIFIEEIKIVFMRFSNLLSPVYPKKIIEIRNLFYRAVDYKLFRNKIRIKIKLGLLS